jgi:hypothetical protein
MRISVLTQRISSNSKNNPSTLIKNRSPSPDFLDEAVGFGSAAECWASAMITIPRFQVGDVREA